MLLSLLKFGSSILIFDSARLKAIFAKKIFLFTGLKMGSAKMAFLFCKVEDGICKEDTPHCRINRTFFSIKFDSSILIL
jgi:hypothetical protein